MPEFATPIEEDKEIHEKVEQYEEVGSTDTGFPEPENPACNPVPDVEYEDESGMPVIPSDLTGLSSRGLGRIFQAVEAWDAYFRSLATTADQDKVRKKEVADLVKAHVKRELREKKVAKDDLVDYVRLDPRYIQANTAYLDARFMAEKVEDLKSMVSRRYNMISREITRRGDDKYGRDPDSGGRPGAGGGFGHQRKFT